MVAATGTQRTSWGCPLVLSCLIGPVNGTPKETERDRVTKDLDHLGKKVYVIWLDKELCAIEMLAEDKGNVEWVTEDSSISLDFV